VAVHAAVTDTIDRVLLRDARLEGGDTNCEMGEETQSQDTMKTK